MVSAAPVSPAVSGDFTQSGTTLTIAAGQTSSTGTVRITAVDNDVDAPDKQVTVSGSASNTQGVTGPQRVTLTIVEDDTPGVEISPTSLELDGGESGTYTVKLTSQPADTDTGTVTVTPRAPPNTGVSLNKSSLTFTSSNWSTAQTVTVSVTADAAPGTVTITHEVEGADYEENNVTADPVTVVIPPPDVFLELSPAEISENGGVSRVTARLSRASGAVTTVMVSAAPVSPAVSGDFTQSGTTLTIAAGQTSSTGTVRITAVDNDVDAPDKQVTVSGSASNTQGVTGPDDVTLTIEDDDVRGVTVSRTSLELDGGESGTYTVKLTSQPAGTDSVTVTPSAPPNTGVSLNKSSLTFTSSNWSTAQTVTVSVTADAAPGTVTITHEVEGADYEENNVTADPVTVVIPPPDVFLELSPAEISENGGVSRVTARLSRASGAVTTVMVSAAPVSPAVSGDFTQSGTTLTIAAGQTSSTGTVRITAADNDVVAPDKQVTVSGSASNTQGVTGPDDVTLTIEDDDVRGVTVSRTSLELDGGESGTYTVKLTSQPAGTDSVTVTPSAPPNTGVSLNTSSLTFSSSNWSTAQTVTVSVTADAAPGTVTITHQVEGSDYEENGVTADPLTVVIPPPHVTLLLSPAEISENGGVSRVTARLSRASGAETTVMVSAAPVSPAVSRDFTQSGTTLTIAAGQTSSTGTVRITAADNDVVAPDKQVTVSGSASNTQGVTGPDDVTLTIEDDDVRGVTVSRTSLELDGGESGTYTVKLTSQPAGTDSVTVTPSAPPNTGVSLNTSSLTFSSSNWSTAQTVTVSVTADAAPGTVTITHEVEGADYEENGVTADPLTVVIPPPHVTLLLSPAEISENGGVSRVTARLSRASGAETTVMVSAAPVSPAVSGDFTQSGTTLTIAAGQTSSTGTVRITAADNDVVAPDKQVTVSGSASNTQGVTGPDDVTLTIEDDDVRGVTVSRTSLELDGGESGTYTVKLTSQPAGTDSVTVTPSAPPNTGVSLNTSSLTFSSSNWSTAQTVTVSVTADAAPGTVTITHQVEGSDYEENGVTADPLTVVIPPPHVTLLLSPDEISENGGTATVTASLDRSSRERTTVTVTTAPVSPASASDYEQSGTTLMIAPGDLTSTGTVTITGACPTPGDKTITVSATASNSEGVTGAADEILTIRCPLDPTPPMFWEASVNGSSLVMWYDEALDTAAPAGSAFTVMVNSSEIGVDSVSISGRKVTLTLSSAVAYVDVVTLSYAVPGTEPLQDLAGNDAVALTNEAVTNNTPAPVLSIQSGTSPVTEGTAAAFTLSRTGSVAEALTASVSVSETGDMIEGTAPSTVRFAANADTATLTVLTNNDSMDEDDSDITASIDAGSAYEVGTPASAEVTVNDDDYPPVTVSFSSATYTATEGGSPAEVTVTLNAEPGREVVIAIMSAPQDGATPPGEPGADYSVIPSMVTFSSSEDSKAFTVSAVDDDFDDDGESVVLSFGTLPEGVTAGTPATATITLEDNNTRGIGVSENTLTIEEPDDQGVAYTVQLTSQPKPSTPGQPAEAVMITVMGHAGTDVTVEPSSLTFTDRNWSAPQEVLVKAGWDIDKEDDEVTLSHLAQGADYAALSGGEVTVTVTDTQPAWAVTVDSEVLAEAGGVATVTVSTGGLLTYDTAQAITLAFRGKAVVGEDFTLASSLTLPAEMTAVTAEIAGVDDMLIEGDETVVITASHGGMEVAAGEATITDDDLPEWSVAVDDDSLDEDAGESATVTARIINGKIYADAQTIAVAVTGTAEVDADFTLGGVAHTPETGYTLELGAESDSVTATITALDDLLADTSETVDLALSLAGAAIGAAAVTISDDDAPVPNVCARTEQVRDAIVAASPVDTCALVGKQHLAQITALDISNSGMSSLMEDDFAGLSALENLQLNRNDFGGAMTNVPENIFADLSTLRDLDLGNSNLGSLRVGLFSSLSQLEQLDLRFNALSSVPVGVFDPLSALQHLNLTYNSLSSLPANLFSELGALQQLYLHDNEITALPVDPFDGLSEVWVLQLSNNRLSEFPEGFFKGLSSLSLLDLRGNSGAPLPLYVTLEKTGNGEFKAVAPAYAPLLMEVRVNVSQTGELDGASGKIRIDKGAQESGVRTVSCAADAHGPVTVTLGKLPGLPTNHNGYQIKKSPDLPLNVMDCGVGLSALALSDGTLSPAFASGTTVYSATVSNAVTQVTVTAAAGDAAATVAYFDGADAPLTDADAGAGGYQVDLAEGPNTIKVKVTAADGATSETYALTVTRAVLVMFSAAEYWVAEGDSAPVTVSLSAAPGREVTIPIAASAQGGATAQGEPDADYSGIPASVTFAATERVQAFDVMATVDVVDEDGEGVALRIGTPPEGVEAGDPVATVVQFGDACSRTKAVCDAIQAALSAGSWGEAAARLGELTELALDGRSIAVLADGDFAGLSDLRVLNLLNNGLPSLPAGIFDELTALERLYLGLNTLTELPVGVFDELSQLVELDLTGNGLTSLPTGVFDELGLLTELNLPRNALGSLPPGVFDHVPLMFALDLSGNGITQVPGDVFSGLTHLGFLSFSSNQLSTLPAGVFEGLSGLSTLSLGGNAVDPLALELSLEKVTDGEFKAAAATGAPFAITLELEAAGPGTLDGGVSTITVDTGGVASAPLGVTRTAGTIDPVTVRIVTLPDHPSSHSGYALQKGPGLPLTVIPAAATLSALTVSEGTLDPVFAPQDTSYTAAVASTVAQITVTATPSDATDTVAYLDAAGAALSDADANTAGHQVDLEVGENTIQVKVTLADTLASRTYTLAVTRATPPVWSVAVRPATIGEAAGAATLTVSTSGAMFAEDQTIALSLTGTATPGDDFTVQSGGSTLTDPDYDLTLAAGATSVTAAITAVADSTAEAEETVNIAASHGGASIGTAVLTITDGICARTEQVRDAIVAAVRVNDSGVTGCGDVTAAHLAALETLGLSGKSIAALAPGDFASLSAVTTLYLGTNQLGSMMNSLPTGVFEGLTSLEQLFLGGNPLGSSLTAGVFDGLGSLTNLSMGNAQLSSLPEGILDGLTSLESLGLASNRLEALPNGVFEGLTSLTALYLGGNAAVPVPLTVTLEKVGADQFKAVMPTGAPFAVAVPVTVASGTVNGSVNATVAIAKGAVASGPLTVSRTAGTTAAVTAAIGTLPGRPPKHFGYALVASEDLPLEVLAEVPVVAIEALSAQVSEAAGAVFTLTRTGPAAEPLTVTVNVTEEGNVLQTPSPDGSAITETATFAADMPTATLTVATDDDTTDEELTAGSALAGRITAEAQSGAGYVLDSQGNTSATVDIEDNDPAAPVTPPAAEALVSNLGQTAEGGRLFVHSQVRVSQAFTTGLNTAGPGGYRIASVEVSVGATPDDPGGVTGSIRSTPSAEPLYVLTNPTQFSVGVNTFTAPAGATLDPDATYYVVLDYTGSQRDDFQLHKTTSGAEDAAGADGWSIADPLSQGGSIIMMRVNGYAIAASSVLLSVADAQAQEAPSATLDFEVTLNYTSAAPVTVQYRTLDGTAVAGINGDYEHKSGALTFAPGETTHTVSAPVHDDPVDDDGETMTLLLFDASGAGVERAQAVGTINNSDSLPMAWLVRFGRTVASHVAEGIGERLMQTERVRPHASIAGLRLPFGESGAPANEPTHDPRDPGYALPWDQEAGLGLGRQDSSSPSGRRNEPMGSSRGLTSRDLLLGSSFLIKLGAKEGKGALSGWTLWGRGMATRFDGSEDDLKLDGEVTTYMVGADTSWDRWLAGVALARSRGDGGYYASLGDRADRGELTSTLTSVHPYVRVTLSERMSAWGVLGYGRGGLTLNRGAAGIWDTDTSMQMAAVGARGVLTPAAYTGGFELAVRSDALWSSISSGASETADGRLAGSEGDASRVRLILEGSRPLTLAGNRTLTPNIELGLRHDAGDAETGTGIELGGGLRYADPTLGLSVEVKARSLIAHEDSEYREWGASAAIRLNPGATGQGLMLTLTPAWGVTASGVERLWSQRDAQGLAGYRDFNADGRLDAELGYALSGPRGMGTQTPYAAMSLSNTGGRTLRVGWRLAMGPKGSLDFEAMRRQSTNGNAPDNSILMRAAVRW